jgi:hypothetical protein
MPPIDQNVGFDSRKNCNDPSRLTGEHQAPAYAPPPIHPPLYGAPPQRAEPNFKINPILGGTACAADLMTGSLDVVSLGTLFSLSLMVAFVILFAGTIIQRHAGDSWSLAFAKATLVALLVAIPGPIGGLGAMAWGIGSGIKGHHDKSRDVDMPN